MPAASLHPRCSSGGSVGSFSCFFGLYSLVVTWAPRNITGTDEQRGSLEGMWNLLKLVLQAFSEGPRCVLGPWCGPAHDFQGTDLKGEPRELGRGRSFTLHQRVDRHCPRLLHSVAGGWGSGCKAKEQRPPPRWLHRGRHFLSCPCHRTSLSTITHHLHIDSPGGDHQLPMQFSRYTS